MHLTSSYQNVRWGWHFRLVHNNKTNWNSTQREAIGLNQRVHHFQPQTTNHSQTFFSSHREKVPKTESDYLGWQDISSKLQRTLHTVNRFIVHSKQQFKDFSRTFTVLFQHQNYRCKINLLNINQSHEISSTQIPNSWSFAITKWSKNVIIIRQN